MSKKPILEILRVPIQAGNTSDQVRDAYEVYCHRDKIATIRVTNKYLIGLRYETSLVQEFTGEEPAPYRPFLSWEMVHAYLCEAIGE